MFNDPQLPSQWHYRNFGNTGTAVEGADINLFEAWKTETGKSDVLVAIIDGGVDYKHEDLAANMYVNLAELNGKPGVDDDGNGYVDDIYGYNFCTNSGEVYPHSHGTHVAGTVAAVNNNGIGVAGVAGGDGTPGSGVRMISCQVFDSRAGAADGDFAAAIIYAAEMGATIAQCSWGWDAPEYYEQAVLDAIDYFTETARSDRMTGGLCIFASGNMGATGNYYPAAYDKVVAVAAMTNELAPASYSNYGEWVDVIAPGGLLDYGEAGGVLSTLPNNEYGFNEGTSMATPHVSGIAALILSKHGSKSFVNESLRTQLTTSVNDFYGFRNNSKYEGLYGSGFIDAAKALAMGDGSAPEAVADFSLDAAQDYIALEWTIPSSNDNNVHHHIIYYSESPFTAATDPGTLSSAVADTKFLSSGEKARHEITGLRPMTTYHVAITAVNRWGKPSAMSAVKSITTNAGPKMTVDATSLSLTSTASAPKASATFAIGNEDDGILKWQASKRTASFKPSTASRPSAGRVVPFAGQTGGVSVRPFSAVKGEYEAADYPVDMAYFEQIWAYIGDTDRSKPNSMAQWFRVDPDKYPDGFNLTDIKIDGMNGTKPRIEIYKGDVAISSASLLQKIQYPYFA
ncbi:MAG: S8 family serine peptidase, partial [Muribaculaceae bacterium]|nr:S8 family serine peptidase [Muribaculaceae bacterium]